MRTIPLTVLTHEGPMARAYLACMRRAGFRPQEILLLVLEAHPATGRRAPRWLPHPVRLAYAERVQDLAFNFWPRRIRHMQKALFNALVRGLSATLEDPGSLLDEMAAKPRYNAYADRVRRVFVSGLRDPRLEAALAEVRTPAILFTGGGIVPERLLAQPQVRFIHVHPGRLPHVRGADGLLWSVLVRGRPGVSCFQMAPGLDTGDVIAATDAPLLEFDLGAAPRPDDTTLYRAIFSYYDPILRGQHLVQLLREQTDLTRLPATPQDTSVGVTYHFMHRDLQDIVLRRIFRGLAEATAGG